MEPLIIGIAGGTASGKTTVARRVAVALGGESCLLISHDRYYHDVLDPESFNYDHPQALQTDQLVQNLRDLQSGQETELPHYDFKSHSRQAQGERVLPRSVVLVEGILVLENPELRALFDLMIYVDAPDDLRLVRRIKRDSVERGRDVQEVLRRWVSTVRPMHIRYVAPTSSFADLQLQGVGLIEPLVDSVLSALKRRREELQREALLGQSLDLDSAGLPDDDE